MFRITHRFLGVPRVSCVGILFIACLNSSASTIQDDWKSVENERVRLEQIRKNLSESIEQLVDRRREFELQWMKCKNDPWRVRFKPLQEELDEVRERIEIKRLGLRSLNNELRDENSKLRDSADKIEKVHLEKGENYERAMRNLIDRYEKYFARLEDEYLFGLREYELALEGYVIVYESAIDDCKFNNFVPAVVGKAIEFIGEHLEEIAKILKK